MVRSMTGFGAAQAEIDGIDYSVEIRSVNGRYFKAYIKLPDIWTHVEADIEKILRQQLSRGTVSFSLRMRARDSAAAHTVNIDALKHYVAQVREALGEQARLDAGAMLNLPGVCEPPSPDEIRVKARETVLATVTRAVEALLDMRHQEGRSVAADLLDHCGTIEQQLKQIVDRKDTVVTDFRNRLTTRVNELINAAELKVSEQDLVREVTVFAERSDISEEISRLQSHLEQFGQILAVEEQAGRKLDFIAQEMLREANTIASKANDATIARAVVEIKTAIDRIKEQVQNVE